MQTKFLDIDDPKTKNPAELRERLYQFMKAPEYCNTAIAYVAQAVLWILECQENVNRALAEQLREIGESLGKESPAYDSLQNASREIAFAGTRLLGTTAYSEPGKKA